MGTEQIGTQPEARKFAASCLFFRRLALPEGKARAAARLWLRQRQPAEKKAKSGELSGLRLRTHLLRPQ